MRRPAALLSATLAGVVAGCSFDFGENGPPQVIPADTCFSATVAIEDVDESALLGYGLPLEVEAGLVTGVIHRRLCASDNLTEHFVITIERTSGQVLIARNTARSLLVNEPAAVAEALGTIGTEVGVFLVDDGAFTRLDTPEGSADVVPLSAILE